MSEEQIKCRVQRFFRYLKLAALIAVITSLAIAPLAGLWNATLLLLVELAFIATFWGAEALRFTDDND